MTLICLVLYGLDQVATPQLGRKQLASLQVYRTVTGYKRRPLACIIYAAFILLTGGVAWLVGHIFPQLTLWTLQSCSLHEAQYILSEVKILYQALMLLPSGTTTCDLPCSLQLYTNRQILSKVHKLRLSALSSTQVCCLAIAASTTVCKRLLSSEPTCSLHPWANLKRRCSDSCMLSAGGLHHQSVCIAPCDLLL